MIEYTKATTEDLEDLIDFINMVFSQDHRPHDFKALLPKLYGDHRDTAGCHYIVRENGKIRAAVGVFPTTMHVGDTELRLGQLGSVSVHPYARGKGYMKALMQEAVRDSREKGMDALVLGGLKNRYQYFGFMPTESAVRFTFLPENIRHLLSGTDSRALSFERVSPGSPCLAEMMALYQSCPVYTDRESPEYFYDVLCSWNGEVYAVRRNGAFAGYLSASKDHREIYEYMLRDLSDFAPMLKAWFERQAPSSLRTRCGMYEREKCEVMGRYCESFESGIGHSWNIFHMEKVLLAWMKIKDRYEPLAPGVLTLNIKNADGTEETCRLCWNSSGTECEKSVEISRLDLIEAAFSEAVEFRSYGECGTMKYQNWFPLPLFIAESDAC